MPNGEVGDYATIVRKDRNSDDWYLGSVTDENARTLEVKLDFLEPGRRYEAQVYRDGDGADWHNDALPLRARNAHGRGGRFADAQARAGRRRGDPVQGALTRAATAAMFSRTRGSNASRSGRGTTLRHRRRLAGTRALGGIRGSPRLAFGERQANAYPGPELALPESATERSRRSSPGTCGAGSGDGARCGAWVAWR